MTNYDNASNNGASTGPRIDPTWAAAATDPPPPPGFGPSGYVPFPNHQSTAHRPTYPPAAPNRMGLAIWATVLFMPLGLFALYLANQVTLKTSLGDTTGAIESSHKARMVAMAAFAIGGFLWLMFLMSACSALMMTPYYY